MRGTGAGCRRRGKPAGQWVQTHSRKRVLHVQKKLSDLSEGSHPGETPDWPPRQLLGEGGQEGGRCCSLGVRNVLPRGGDERHRGGFRQNLLPPAVRTAGMAAEPQGQRFVQAGSSLLSCDHTEEDTVERAGAGRARAPGWGEGKLPEIWGMHRPTPRNVGTRAHAPGVETALTHVFLARDVPSGAQTEPSGDRKAAEHAHPKGRAGCTQCWAATSTREATSAGKEAFTANDSWHSEQQA